MFQALALAALWASPLAAQSSQSSVIDVVRTCSPAVVGVDVHFGKTNSGGRITSDGVNAVRVERPGSGILVGKGGLVLTNAHLVEEVREGSDEYWITVFLGNGRAYTASILQRDEATDLALLQIEGARGETFTTLELGSSHSEPVGTRVIALSSPSGGRPYAFAGALAFAAGPLKLREATLSADQVLLSDARFHDLLDGGPLLNEQGQIIGIHNSSHLSPLPPGFGGEDKDDDEEEEVDLDYAVIVSSEAIAEVFGEQIGGITAAASRVAGESANAVAAIAPSVVSVWNGAEDEEFPSFPDVADPQAQRIPATLGSGVIVDASGLVLTSSDFFQNDEGLHARIRLADGTIYPATLLARRDANRTALLKVELPEGVSLPAAVLGDSEQTIHGEFAAVIARPFYSAINMSIGVVSALDRAGLGFFENVGDHSGEDSEGFMQLASWVHPGHWGGAVVDRNGRLIAIAIQPPASSERANKDSYLGFATPIANLQKWFGEEWTAAGGTNTPTSASAEELETRHNVASRVMDRTRSSLINIMVSQAVEQESTGFNPFGSTASAEYQLQSQGSGVIIEKSGLAISNWHVVHDALEHDGSQNPDYKIEVTLPDGRRFEARVLSTSRDDDLSLLALQIEPDDVLVPIEMGNSDRLRPGQPVIAIGNPLGLANSVTAGIISTTDLDTRIQGRLREYKGMVMTDAAINPGNSGGALLDTQGRLVGINSAGSVGRGMAIPVNKAREVFSDKLLSAKSLRTAYLGFQIEERDGGLFVKSVDEGGPGERAELEAGDLLQGIANQSPTTQAAFARLVIDLDPSVPCPLVVERDGEPLGLSLQPISFTSWEILRRSGLEVLELDYSTESETIQAAGLSLHRAYTQNPTSAPSRSMGGALRVMRVSAIGDRDAPLVKAGDLLLGVTQITAGTADVHESLERFESIADLSAAFAPRATKEGETCQCWLLRDGEVITVDVFVQRPPRQP